MSFINFGAPDDDDTDIYIPTIDDSKRIRTLQITRLVAEHWRRESLKDDITRIIAHPMCMILNALDGEIDPREIGVSPDSAEGKAIKRISE